MQARLAGVQGSHAAGLGGSAGLVVICFYGYDLYLQLAGMQGSHAAGLGGSAGVVVI